MHTLRNNLRQFLRAWGKSFLIALVFAVLSAGLFWLDEFRRYEAEVRVMVMGTSSALDMEQTVNTLALFPSHLSFYDRILADDHFIEDPFEGLPQDQRKAAWNGMVRSVQEGKSGIVVITARGGDVEAARFLARRTAQTLPAVAGLYYDIKSDIDIRIVDGPIGRTVIERPFAYAAVSLVSGCIATVAFFLFLVFLPDMIGGARHRHRTQADSAAQRDPVRSDATFGDSVLYIDPRKFIPEKPTGLPFEVTSAETRIPSSAVKASAPANLPIASEEFFSGEALEHDWEGVNVPTEEASEPLSQFGIDESDVSASEAPRSEPTAEEYKRRLNELLQGGK